LNFNDIIEIDIILESGKEKQINQYIYIIFLPRYNFVKIVYF
jgi:hypothetical protein